MSWCDTCTNQDGAECIACQGWKRGSLAAEVADAQRVVALWPAEKRARVQLEGPSADGVKGDTDAQQ
jgi:hypothetical protein